MARWKVKEESITSTFSADIVWGCAVAVDRISGGYLKHPLKKWNADLNVTEITQQANKHLVKAMLANQDYASVTEQDIEDGKEVRQYCSGFLLKRIAGKIREFETVVLRIAQLNEFTNRNLLEFSIISCLPANMRRELKRQAVQTAMWESTKLVGNIGDSITTEIEIVKCFYVDAYNKYSISARAGESFVSFWFKDLMPVGNIFKIHGRISKQRDDGSTKLNYVKIK